jgi:hypothetical protein
MGHSLFDTNGVRYLATRGLAHSKTTQRFLYLGCTGASWKIDTYSLVIFIDSMFGGHDIYM